MEDRLSKTLSFALENLEVVPTDIDEDVQKMTINCKLLTENGYKKRFCIISNHWIDFYKNRESKKAKYSKKMEDIDALYINSLENQIVCRTMEPPNIVVKTKHAKDVLRLLYAINLRDGCQVFQIPQEDLDEYMEDEDYPDEEYLISEKQEDDEDEFEDLDVDCSSEDGEAGFEEMSNAIASMGRKIYSSVRKTKLSSVEENHKNLIHLGSEDDEDDGDDTPRSRHSQESSKSDEEDVPLPKLKSQFSLTHDGLKEFKVLGNLGEGSFAKVVVAIDKENNLYAMKKMNKSFLEETKVDDNVKNEHKILRYVDNRFLLSMKHYFEDDNKIYFFTEFMAGKDLKYQMEVLDSGFTLNEVRMIGAQMILALECLHKNGYIHRDIKPENIMIDERGYIKLADFGLANCLSNKKKTGLAGNIEYMDPSVIKQDKYCNLPSVDWWAFGILLYHLHYKETPFCNYDIVATFREETEKQVKDFILNQELQFPSNVQSGRDREYRVFKKLLHKLLVKDPSQRLPWSKSGRGGSKIKKHKFFEGIDWEALDPKRGEPKLEMPFIPRINYSKLKKLYKKAGVEFDKGRFKDFS
ncbi:unnamed protein product [Moneuplotes crassus]|uniref:Uncharacterized protein n=3 Tax=Euplotes crassus TaxID=5936 RepID=A0AAD2DD24_EUPCR|nr:unnamed protein product [Moneuplotes crassus]